MNNGIKNQQSKKENMSSVVVQSYMQGHNFTKDDANCAVRPPTIGEEHEVASIDGRQSTHSSVSGKSEATLRRTDVDLGYEPEGSDSPLPAYKRWKLSLYNMLDDSEGVKTFMKFLNDSNQQSILEGWLAMKGFRSFGLKIIRSENSSAASSTTGSLSNKSVVMDQETKTKRVKLAKKIYKSYLGSTAPAFVSAIIKDATKSYISTQIKDAQKLLNHELDSDLFHQAQTEIELNVEKFAYKNFLESDRFSQYSAEYENSSSSKTNLPSNESSTTLPQTQTHQTANASDSVNESDFSPQSGRFLYRVEEGSVWNLPNNRSSQQGSGGGLRNEAIRNAMGRNMNPPRDSNVKCAAYPYYTQSWLAPPASAIGSDQTSRSSDATSDTLSRDSSSIDMTGYPQTIAGQKRMMRKQIKENPVNSLPACCHVPRTHRISHDKKEIPTMATKNPAAFFELLCGKLENYKEELKKQKILANRAARKLENNKAAVAAADEEDMDKLLDHHCANVFHSPGDRNSPPVPIGKKKLLLPQDPFYGQPKPIATAPETLPGSYESASTRNMRLQELSKAKKKDAAIIRQRQDTARAGLVPGMAQNEVPDVPTPVNPVDKNQMIHAWIQMDPPTSTSYRNNKSEIPYVHPMSSTGLTAQSALVNRTGGKKQAMPLQPLAQDPSLPLLAHPDANTTIEEVKRRLIAETEAGVSFPLSNMSSLSQHLPTGNALNPSTSSFSLKPQGSSEIRASDLLRRASCSGSDSSTETATFANTTTCAQAQNSSESVEEKATTVVYYMPQQPVPYKVKIPCRPLTLGLFKQCLTKKNQYKYYFKQRSVEMGRAVYFEVAKDDELLPFWEGNVVARLELQTS